MKQSLDITGEVARLNAMTLFELRKTWRRVCRMHPPTRYSADLLIRGITYKLQERAQGGLSKSQLRRLDGACDADAATGRQRRHALEIKPGTRLVREWHGVTHSVLVLASGVEWQGRRYRSLSVVAREITGAHWSGPRFFGLTKRAHKKNE